MLTKNSHTEWKKKKKTQLLNSLFCRNEKLLFILESRYLSTESCYELEIPVFYFWRKTRFSWENFRGRKNGKRRWATSNWWSENDFESAEPVENEANWSAKRISRSRDKNQWTSGLVLQNSIFCRRKFWKPVNRINLSRKRVERPQFLTISKFSKDWKMTKFYGEMHRNDHTRKLSTDHQPLRHGSFPVCFFVCMKFWKAHV